MRGCFARWLSGERGGKRAVKHGKSGLRAAICALFGTLRGDLSKTVEKLCKSLQGVKTKITNCAQRFVRLCVLVRELCKYRFLSAFGEWAVRCGGAPFGRFPSRLRRRGAHLGGEGGDVGGQGLGRRQASVGCCARGRPPLPSPSPTLRSALRPSAGRSAAVGGLTRGKRTALRPSAGGGSVLGGLTRGERTGRSGDCLVHSAFAHSDSDISGQVRGRRQGKCGALREGASTFAFVLPHPALGTSPISGQGLGRRRAEAGRTHGRSGDCLVHFRLCARRYAISWQGRGRRRASAGCCARGRPPLPSPSPTLRTPARATWPQRRRLFPTATRTLPGSSRRANDILYIRVRRREGENVLHRAASNDVDNFSVDNPLWITATAGGRSLRGRRRRLCRGSVNDGAEI